MLGLRAGAFRTRAVRARRVRRDPLRLPRRGGRARTRSLFAPHREFGVNWERADRRAVGRAGRRERRAPRARCTPAESARRVRACTCRRCSTTSTSRRTRTTSCRSRGAISGSGADRLWMAGLHCAAEPVHAVLGPGVRGVGRRDGVRRAGGVHRLEAARRRRGRNWPRSTSCPDWFGPFRPRLAAGRAGPVRDARTRAVLRARAAARSSAGSTSPSGRAACCGSATSNCGCRWRGR